MRIFLLFIAIFTAFPANASDGEPPPIAIVIDLHYQKGGYYRYGKLILEFEVMTGDSLSGEKPTKPGKYWIRRKEGINYWSKKYGAPMPYAMFFSTDSAIHARGIGSKLPPRELRREYSSHGCVSTDFDVAEWLHENTPIGTPVDIVGDRVPEKIPGTKEIVPGTGD